MKALWKFISVLLAVGLTFTAMLGLFGFTAIGITERMFTEDAVRRMMDHADVDAIITKIVSNNGGNVVSDIASSETMKDIMTQYVTGFWHYMVTGEDRDIITEEQKTALIDSVVDVLAQEAGADNEASRKVLRMQLEVTLDSVLEQNMPSYSELLSDMDEEDMMIFHIIFSDMTKGILLAMVIVSLLLIMLIRFSWYEWMVWGGVAGTMISVLLLMGRLFLAMALEASATGDVLADQLMGAIFGEFGSGLVLYGCCMLAVSVGLIVIYAVIASAIRRRNQADAYREAL